MNTSRHSFASGAPALVLLALACTASSHAAQTNVSIADNLFSPSVVTIQENDSVRWVWTGFNLHTSTRDGLWDSGVRGNGSTFTNTFPNAGSFPYYCGVHFGMNGSVTVQAAPADPPDVAIVDPAEGAVFAEPASFILSADATGNGGSVTNVEFFRGAISLGNDPNAPYSLPVNNLAAGNHTFTAVAKDDLGGSGTSPAVSIDVVTPVDVVISNLQLLSPTAFRFDYTANAGLRYFVERSTDMITFTSLGTNTAAGGVVPFTNNAAPADQGFYRVGRLPNP